MSTEDNLKYVEPGLNQPIADSVESLAEDKCLLDQIDGTPLSFEGERRALFSEVENLITNANEIKIQLLNMKQNLKTSEKLKLQSKLRLGIECPVSSFFQDIGSKMLRDNGIHGMKMAQIKTLHDLTYIHMLPKIVNISNLGETSSSICDLQEVMNGLQLRMAQLKKHIIKKLEAIKCVN